MDGWAKILTQDNIVEGVKKWQDGQDKTIERAALKKKAKGSVQSSNGCLESVRDGLEGAQHRVEG